ncbi:MAG: hypothetical protein ACR2NU_02135, partial [Aeoliella sp.]
MAVATRSAEPTKAPPPALTSRGEALDVGPECFGSLVPLDDRGASREEMESHVLQHGYLYIRDFFPREQVLAARRA